MAGDLDIRELPEGDNNRDTPLYWGMWGLIVIEAMVFSSLASSYLYLRSVTHSWPPDGVEPPELLLPTINTVVILASIPFVRLADRAVRNDRRLRLVIGLSGSLVLALVFLAIKAVEFEHMEIRWDDHAYGSTIYALIGFHALHVIALVLKTIVIIILAVQGYFGPRRNLGVQVNGIYWYFVVVIWIPLYALVYLSPRVLP